MTAQNSLDERDRQEPLGPHPDYQHVLDVASEYSFPCSDPIAVDACCASSAKRQSKCVEASELGQQANEPRPTSPRPAP